MKMAPSAPAVLHPAQHRAGHLRLNSGYVGACPGKGFLNLIHEDDHTRSFLAVKNGNQELLDVVATADVIECLSISPDGQARRLLDSLTLSLPQPVEVEPALRERHRQHLFSGK